MFTNENTNSANVQEARDKANFKAGEAKQAMRDGADSRTVGQKVDEANAHAKAEVHSRELQKDANQTAANIQENIRQTAKAAVDTIKGAAEDTSKSLETHEEKAERQTVMESMGEALHNGAENVKEGAKWMGQKMKEAITPEDEHTVKNNPKQYK